jgi:mannosyltransferase OCH1-like enzyme
MDIDSICKEPIQDEFFMDSDFFVAYEHITHPGRIANGVIGSAPGHPILKEYIKRIGEAKKIRPIWNTIGGTMLTNIIENYGKKRIIILPTCSFYPKNWDGLEAPVEGKIYAEQFWGTTKNLYDC